MSFGLRNTTQTFERFIDKVLRVGLCLRVYPCRVMIGRGASRTSANVVRAAIDIRGPNQLREMHVWASRNGVSRTLCDQGGNSTIAHARG